MADCAGCCDLADNDLSDVGWYLAIVMLCGMILDLCLIFGMMLAIWT